MYAALPHAKLTILAVTLCATGTDTLACSRDTNERLLFFDIFRKAEELKRAHADVQSQAEQLEAAQETISDLEATNERIKKQIAVSGLSDMQVRYVEEHASDIQRHVRPEFNLDWREITFKVLLGSGTFGDCYEGTIGKQAVAVSRS